MIFLILLGQIFLSYPDPKLTPGEVDPTITSQDICKPGYAKKRRHVTENTKKQVFSKYHIKYELGKYEVDHLVSLELGGTNSIKNLGIQPYEPRPGAHEKDKVENYLHQQVCKGKISLKEAQHLIVTDWLSIYNKIK